VPILANAFVCGALSNVEGRYQARVAWLIPFAAIVVAARIVGFGSRRRADPSGRS
jgi:hypothetical protein